MALLHKAARESLVKKLISPGPLPIKCNSPLSGAKGSEDSAIAIVVEPNEIIISTNPVNASCYGDCDGNISINTSGGTTPYSYSWSNGETTQNITGLCAGSYNLTITDSNNCSAVTSVIVNEPIPLLINIWSPFNSDGYF